MKQTLPILIEVALYPQQEPRYGRILPEESLPPSFAAVLLMKYVLPWASIEESKAETALENRRRAFEQEFSDASYDRDEMLVY